MKSIPFQRISFAIDIYDAETQRNIYKQTAKKNCVQNTQVLDYDLSENIKNSNITPFS